MKLNPRIVLASVVGLTLVGSAFALSRGEEAVEPASTAPERQPVRSFIAVADADGNGIPDWQESLNIPTIYLDESPAVSATMTKTAALAVDLATYSAFGQTGGAASVLSDLSSRLAAESTDRQYGRGDIRIGSSDSPDSLRAYGNRVAAITFEQAPPRGTENELTLLNRAFARGDAMILAGLDPTIASYEGMIAAMLQTEVPPSLVREHLSLINVYNAILSDIRAFRGVFSDALPAMTRLRRYQADTEALYLAISNLYLKLDQSGIKWGDNDAVSRFIKIE